MNGVEYGESIMNYELRERRGTGNQLRITKEAGYGESITNYELRKRRGSRYEVREKS